MAELLWGKVYFKKHFAGFLREEPGGGTSFSYDESYLEAGLPPIAHTLPIGSEPAVQHVGLYPYFDNLVAEGWLEEAQTRLLGKRIASRFELLLAFGQDCAGAVSVVDPQPAELRQILVDESDPMAAAVLTSRASLSGIQPKLVLVERDGVLHATKVGELSTHIAKFPSRQHDDLVVNEYLSTLAFKKYLPEDDVVELRLGEIAGVAEQALIIKRFDRDTEGNRIHFEEFNQLLGKKSVGKYNGSHKNMADFIYNTKGCLPTEVYRLYLRILVGLLIGNTDMHFKNFAMLHGVNGLSLTPSYDQVCAAVYNYVTVALAIGNSQDLLLGKLRPGNIIKLGKEFGLSADVINMAYKHLDKHRAAAKEAIIESEIGTDRFKDKLISLMEKRWKGTFALIGQSLSKKQ